LVDNENNINNEESKIFDKDDNGNQPADFRTRCINIDCVFNSSIDINDVRNLCNNPALNIKSEKTEITLAICSEFRSKKDYKFVKPDVVIDLKTNTSINIEKPAEEVTVEEISVITQKELIDDVNEKKGIIEENIPLSPQIIETPVSENLQITLTNGNLQNFQILKRLYQPYLKRGLIFSVIIHLVAIGIFYSLFSSGRGKSISVPPEQRIVVIEDIEQPKFEPPDVDKKTEISDDGTDVASKEVRPDIKPKNIKPKITRPTEKIIDTNLVNNDSNSISKDTSSFVTARDTNMTYLPDSLFQAYMTDTNFIPITFNWPNGWIVKDTKNDYNYTKEVGVTIQNSLDADSLTTYIVLRLNPDPVEFDQMKRKIKNTILMKDTTYECFATDPEKSIQKSKKVDYNFWIDTKTKYTVIVKSETKPEFFEINKLLIEGIVRSIRILKKQI
jgi:hypothetical protein